MAKLKTLFRTASPELVIWLCGMTILALYPFGNGHFTICPLKNAGLSFCPGCGLGISIHHLFHLDFAASFHSHPLGIFAVAVISARIYTLFRSSQTLKPLLTKRNYNA